jgi:hypothetical protein
MGVGSADTKGVHAGTSRGRRPWPGTGLSADHERAEIEVELRVRRPEVDRAGDQPVLQGQHDLDEADHAGGSVGVADAGLYRAEHAEAGGLSALSKSL